MYTLGIDIGSTACKAVIMENGVRIAGEVVIQTGTGTSGPQRAYDGVLKNAGLTAGQLSRTVATGYGRMTFEQADQQISELSCHARGVHFLMPDVSTIIDIGGQDAKALRLSEQGTLNDFVMNDKCAAGTGRFLDVMARVLEVNTSDLAEMSAKSTVYVPISNVCTVFAESEVISQLAMGVNRNDIVAGIHISIAKRVAALAKRVGMLPDVAMTGGVAQNMGVVRAMREVLGVDVEAAPFPQLTGAIGAAILAYEHTEKELRK